MKCYLFNKDTHFPWIFIIIVIYQFGLKNVSGEKYAIIIVILLKIKIFHQ
jgi:hypothetical protein